MKNFDYVIIGAGILGLSLARELRSRDQKCGIAVFEKEAETGLHASGRNSGVLHSGIYYSEGSLKAKLCSSGAKEMASYCEENRLPLNHCGKIILPIRETDGEVLETLKKRALANGAKAEMIDGNQIKELEPEADSILSKALFCPGTAVIEPKTVLVKLVDDLRSSGVEIQFGAPIHQIDVESKKNQCWRESILIWPLV